MNNSDQTLPPEPAEDMPLPVDTSDEQLAELVRDAQETYFAAASTGQFAAAASALSLKLRALSLKAEREAAREKRDGLLDGCDPCDEFTWPDELRHFHRLWMDHLLVRIADAERNRDCEVNTHE